ncbi:TrbI/VirB10 family protein [Asticcacaulis sp. SL142]|uniref:TrbI/VirB10 family protein n=1 Tax=Asticcacaulis sp. SL142 TaxID=2995155 RepID=UPI00226C7D3C|nr:TrbI/VirB10 family protein [Asticcacaulis sp. SL142]WAC48215.1 TrbI/VirB10 family protein [Asticcacaulis sp. SL142]
MTEPVNPLKADPETLVLRAQPRRVVRFKRHLLVGATAIGSVALVSIAWMGLSGSKPKVPEAKELYDPEKRSDNQKPRPEALTALPHSYVDLPGSIPQLGPPLPGDLGGPMLEAQRGQVTPVIKGSDQRSAPAEAQRDSGLFFQVATRNQNGQVAGPPPPDPLTALGLQMRPELPRPEVIPVVRDRRDTGGIYNSHTLETPRSPYQVMAGTVISASLVTGLKSDLPGFVIAQVTQPVFDTVTGHHLLIPQGTRLLGEYDNQIGFGQSRALLVWKRLILPDGSSLEIDNLPATDRQGYAGLSDRVDYHTWSLLKGVGLSTLLGIAAHSGQTGDDSDLIRAFREATRDTANQAGQRIVEIALNIQPSLTVRPGWPVRVVVHKDLILKPYKGA